MTTASWDRAPTGFDEIAAIYDEIFTHSLIGQAQRRSVWDQVDRIWKAGDQVLELNCGTGEDALYLAGKGIRVTACDASPSMIAVSNHKKDSQDPPAPIEFLLLPNEHIDSLIPDRGFDGVLSNFSGLNCVADLSSVARPLAGLVRPGGELALCFSTRFCIWELLWYAIHGEWKKSARRWKGHAVSSISGRAIDVWYPSVANIRSAFFPWFQFVRLSGVGVAIPPSYVEAWVQEHPRIFSALREIDRWIRGLPLIRAMGDHMLLRFRRCS
jgi:ubiquinone/menaquinone biosynthesis C-methylase UbiE